MRSLRLAVSAVTLLAAVSADPPIRLSAQVPGGKLTKEIRAAVIDTVAVVRRGEIALFDGLSPEEIAARTRSRH